MGFPITLVPFLPVQSLFASVAAVFVRGNVLLCIALQFLSTPLTAPVHLSACYFVGEVVRGRPAAQVWREVMTAPGDILTGDSLTSLYLGAAILGIGGGLAGYFIIRSTWQARASRRPRSAVPPPK